MPSSLDESLDIFKHAGDGEAIHLLREIAEDIDELPDVWRLLAEQEPRVARRIERKIIDLSDRVDEDKLADVRSGEEIEQMIHFEDWLKELEDDMKEPWRKAWMTGAEVAAYESDIRIVRGFVKQDTPDPAIEFNVANPLAVEWAEVHGGQFIAEIKMATKKAINKSIAQALQRGLGVDEETRRLLKLQIGLTEQQAGAVDNYAQRLKTRKPPLSKEQFDKRVLRYRNAKQRLRAHTIARTELAFGSSAGQEGLWQQAAKQELLNTAKLNRKWLSTPVGRCAICAGLSKLPSIPFEKTFEYAGKSYQNAPAHPNCRCTVGLVKARKKMIG